jgi:excinuclease UvrABC helicase subunit UvrB
MAAKLLSRNERLKEQFEGISDEELNEKLKEIHQANRALEKERLEIRHEMYRRNPTVFARVIKL